MPMGVYWKLLKKHLQCDKSNTNITLYHVSIILQYYIVHCSCRLTKRYTEI
jgi:type III secretory pathway component EscR